MKSWLTHELNSRLARVPVWLWPTRLRVIVVLIAVFAIWGWFDVRNRGAVDPNNLGNHKTDLTVYTEAGAAFFDGRDPYSVTNPRGWKYLYPPPFAMLSAPLHGFDPRTQVLVWFGLSLLMGWGCYHETVRIGRVLLPQERQRSSFGSIPTWIGYAAIMAAMLPALNCLQRGQVGVAKIYLLLLGFRVLVESRFKVGWFLAGVIFALPITLKVTPLVPVAFVLLQQFVSAWRGQPVALARGTAGTLGTLCGLGLCLFVVPAALIGWNANLHHLDTWWTTAAHAEHSLSNQDAGDSYSVRNQSLANAVERFTNWVGYEFADGPRDDVAGLSLQDSPMEPAIDGAVLAAQIGVGVLLLVVGLRGAAAPDPLKEAAGFGLACVATLLVSPIARGHYYVLLLPGTMFVSLWLMQQQRLRWAIFFAIWPAFLTIAHYALMNLAGRVGLLGIGTLLWYGLAAMALLRFDRRTAARDERTMPQPGSQTTTALAQAA